MKARLPVTTTIAMMGAALVVTACSTEEPQRKSLLLGRSPTSDVQTLDGKPISPDARAKTLEAIGKLNGELGALKADLAEAGEQLTRERDREGKLTRELTDLNTLGCWGNAKISKMEIRINGAHLEHGRTWESQQPVQSAPNSAQVGFTFGSGIAYTNPNEETLALFAANGKYLTEAFKERRTADVEFIRIEKGGMGVDSVKHCWKEWLVLQRCRWQHEEINVYRLDDLEIEINGQLLYQKQGISFTFDGEHLVWEDRNLSLNPAYQTLMARTDCPTSQ